MSRYNLKNGTCNTFSIKVEYAEINNFQFFFSEHTQIILSKITYIDIIIIYVSVMPCLQIQTKMDCP